MSEAQCATRNASCAGRRSQRSGVRSKSAVLVLALALLAGACGDDDPGLATSTPPDLGAFPVLVRGFEISKRPQRIVSLSATHTEVLYEIGAGPAIVATDVFSDFPAAAANTTKIDAYNLSVEAVAELDPDLVVLSFDPGDAVSGFGALGIPVVLFAPPGPVTLDEVYAEWADLGRASGHADEAGELIEQVRRDVAVILDAFPPPDEPPTFFVELDSTLFTAGADTLIDHVFSLAGLRSIADPSDGAFPQFSAEALVAADPDFYFLADTVCCGESAGTVAARPGFDLLTAVGEGRVVELDDSLVSRWGPRVVEFLLVVATEAAARS